MTELVVLEHPLSPYAQKVKLALHFKGLPFEVRQPAIGADADAFVRASPRAEVPVLEVDGVPLYQSSVIGQFVEERWPEPSMMAGDAMQRAQRRLLEDAIDTHFEANTWGLGELRFFGRGTGEEVERLRAHAREQILGWFAWLEDRLGDASWFAGAGYGWADMCVVPFANGAGRFDLVPPRGSKLEAWLARVNDRDDVALVRSQAEAAELDPELMRAALEAGFKREYRDHRLEWMVRGGGLDVVRRGLADGNIRFNSSFDNRVE